MPKKNRSKTQSKKAQRKEQQQLQYEEKLKKQPDVKPSVCAHGSNLNETVTVTADGNGTRLDAWLAPQLGITRSRVGRAAKAGYVLVDGKAGKASSKLRTGQTLDYRDPPREPLRVVAEDLGIASRVLFEDEVVLVIDKPAGMSVHPAGGLVTGTLVNGLLHYFGVSAPIVINFEEEEEGKGCENDTPDKSLSTRFLQGVDTNKKELKEGIVRPGIVHRLDRFTSGVMVVAKDPNAHAHLHAQFAAKTTDRQYEAIVCGVPPDQDGRVTSHIARDPMDRLRMAVVPDSATSSSSSNDTVNANAQTQAEAPTSSSAKRFAGKFAATNWKKIHEFPDANVSVLQLILETGRTHQIRVHCSGILNTPLLGDSVYGGANSGGKTHPEAARVPVELHQRMPRQALHARTLAFSHPVSGKRLSFESKRPDDFCETLRTLGLDPSQ